MGERPPETVEDGRAGAQPGVLPPPPSSLESSLEAAWRRGARLMPRVIAPRQDLGRSVKLRRFLGLSIKQK